MTANSNKSRNKLDIRWKGKINLRAQLEKEDWFSYFLQMRCVFSLLGISLILNTDKNLHQKSTNSHR